MKSERIGNDIKIEWSILREGTPFSLSNKDVSIYLGSQFGRTKISGFTIDSNKVIWTFFGKDQKSLGKYSLVLVINEGNEGMITTDICDFVNLVRCTCEVGGSDDGNVQTETIALTSNLEYVASEYYDDTAIWEYIEKMEKAKADKAEIPTRVSQLENDAEYATVGDLGGKQDKINDLDAIRSGAAKGATALQSIPAEFINESELYNALSPYARKSDIATINGKSIVNGGNIVIEGGSGGGSYDDTGIKKDISDLKAKDTEHDAELAKLSAELIYDDRGENALDNSSENWQLGYMRPNGKVSSSSTNSYNVTPIKVYPGEVIRAFEWLGTRYSQQKFVKVCAFYRGSVVDTLGSDAPISEYIVPNGVDGVVISGKSSIQLVTINQDIPPSQFVEYTPPVGKPNPTFFANYEQAANYVTGLLRVVQPSKNKFNKETAVIGLLDSNGNVDVAQTNYFTSDFIPVQTGQMVGMMYWISGTKYQGGFTKICYYDEQKVVIDSPSAYGSIERCLAEGCHYMRVSLFDFMKDSAVILVGDTTDDIQEPIPYGEKVEYLSELPKSYKVAFDGDSITWGTMPAPSQYPTYKGMRQGYSYADEVCHKFGWDLYKFAVSMSPLAYNADGTANAKTPLVDRFTKIPKDCDLIYIAIGSNDWGYPQIALGQYGDTEKTSFYGALDYLCRGLKENYPTTMVVFGTIIKRYRAEGIYDAEKGYTNAAGEYVEDYNNAIRRVCGHYSYPVVDMYDKSCVNAWLEGDRAIMIEDGIHPNHIGQSLMAKICANALIGYLQ